jgi:hypothetical protein
VDHRNGCGQPVRHEFHFFLFVNLSAMWVAKSNSKSVARKGEGKCSPIVDAYHKAGKASIFVVSVGIFTGS